MADPGPASPPAGLSSDAMGLMARRERKVAEGAPGFIEAGETVRAVAMVQTDGIPPQGAARAERKAAKKFTVHAVVATDAAIYLLPVSGLSSIEGVLARIPLGEARIELAGGRMRVCDREFHVLPFGGKGAQSLVRCVTNGGSAQ
jgi:hypothetical protein